MFVVTAVATTMGAPSAHAQLPADLTIAASGNPNLSVGGGAQRVVFTVSNAGPGDAERAVVRIDVPLAEQGVKIQHGPDGCRLSGNTLVCRVDQIRRGGSSQIPIQIAPPASGGPAPGQSQQGQGQARVGYNSDSDPNNNSAAFTVTLNGPDRPDNVPSVSGTVTDNKTTKPVANAKVTLTDEKGAKRKTATNKNGQYKITSTESKPIAPGTLKITVTKDGYDDKDITKTGNPGEAVKADALMIPKVKASASKRPAAKDTEAATDPGEEEGTSWFVWLLYVFAALLVIGGIALIVWLMKGRNEDEDEDDGYDDSPRRHGPAPIGARGVYGGDPYGAPTTAMGGTQPTTVLGGEAPTSMINRPGMDQPTSMINRSGMDQPTSMINRSGMDQPTSMIDRTGLDQPTRQHGTLPPDDDIYPQGRETYAAGHGYGPGSGYGEPTRGDLGYHDSGPARDPGYGHDPGYGDDQGYRGDPGYGNDPGYGHHAAPGGGRHAQPPPPQDPYQDQGYERPSPRRSRHAREDDRRLDWYED